MGEEKLEVLILAKDAASGVFSKVGSALGGAFKVGLGFAAAGIGALATGLGFAINEAMAAEGVTAQLEAVLKSTGGVAGVTAQAAQGLAEKFSGLTRFEDDAILAGENILLTFTNIGKDVFPDATQTILDMSTALGTDLQSSAIQLGKALQDPIAGISALSRVGVNFTDAQKKMIEQLVKAGKVEEAQKLILKELQTEFGGSAEAAGKTFAGRLDILKNKLGNVAESIGGMVLPALTDMASGILDNVIPTVEKLGGALPQAFEYLKKGQVGNAVKWIALQLSDLFGPKVTVPMMKFGDTLQSAFDGLKPIFDTLVTAGQEVITALMPLFDGVGNFIVGLLPSIQGFADTVMGVVATFGPPIMEIFGKIRDIVLAVLPGIQGLVNAVVDFGTQAIAMVGPFVTDTLEKLSAWFTENGPMIETIVNGIMEAVTTALNDYILPAVKGFWEWIEPVLGSLIDFILDIGSTILKMATGDWSGAWETMKEAAGKLWDSIKAAWETMKTWFKTTLIPAITDIGKNIIDGLKQGVKDAFDKFIAWFKGLINLLPEAVKKLLGISSPSKVFETFGKQMMLGLAKGIQSAANLPQLALNGVSANLVASGGGLAGGGGSWADNSYTEINQNLTIVSNANSERLASDFRLMQAWKR